MMRKIYGWTTNLFRYIYILLVAVWLCSRFYVMRQSLFGKTVLIQVAFSLIVPFLYAVLTGLFLKGKRIGKLRPAGAQRNGRMTLILGILAGALVLFCGIMIHRQPVFLPRTTGEVLNWMNGRLMALGMRPGTFLIFAIPFAACLTQRKLKKVSDLRALFLLISADAFGVAALLSGYTKVCSYGFFVFSLLFALQYVRICYREAYGDAIFRAPKKKEKPQWIKAGKKKKGAVIAIAVLVIIVAIGIFKCSSKDEILRYNVHVINNTGFDIYALYASEPDVDNWEEDLLEDGIVYDGERVDIEFVITEEDLDWDFAIEDFEGNVLEFYGLSFAECDVEGATLILEYDGYKGTASLY